MEVLILLPCGNLRKGLFVVTRDGLAAIATAGIPREIGAASSSTQTSYSCSPIEQHQWAHTSYYAGDPVSKGSTLKTCVLTAGSTQVLLAYHTHLPHIPFVAETWLSQGQTVDESASHDVRAHRHHTPLIFPCVSLTDFVAFVEDVDSKFCTAICHHWVVAVSSAIPQRTSRNGPMSGIYKQTLTRTKTMRDHNMSLSLPSFDMPSASSILQSNSGERVSGAIKQRRRNSHPRSRAVYIYGNGIMPLVNMPMPTRLDVRYLWEKPSKFERFKILKTYGSCHDFGDDEHLGFSLDIGHIYERVGAEALEWLYTVSSDMPVYTIVAPRPLKPPWPLCLQHYNKLNQQLLVSGLIKATQLTAHIHQSIDIAKMSTSQESIDPSAFWDFPQSSTLWDPDIIIAPSWPYMLDFNVGENPLVPHRPEPYSQCDPRQQPGDMPSFGVYNRDDGNVTESGDSNDRPQRKRKRVQGRRAKNISMSSTSTEGISSPHSTTDHFSSASSNTNKTAPSDTRFACPFLKNDYDKHCGTCLGTPGWPNFHRLKEHILRRHSCQDQLCSRCHESFPSDSELFAHQRAEPPCPVKPRVPGQSNGMLSMKQIAAIKKRKKGRADEDKWRDLYRIIFPWIPDAEIPSPYPEKLDRHTASEEGDAFEEYLRRLIAEHDGDPSGHQSCLEQFLHFRRMRRTSSAVVNPDNPKNISDSPRPPVSPPPPRHAEVSNLARHSAANMHTESLLGLAVPTTSLDYLDSSIEPGLEFGFDEWHASENG